MDIRTKRVYNPVDKEDGIRVLVGPSVAAWNDEGASAC